MLLKSLLIVSGLLPLVGYLRFSIDTKKPNYLLSPEIYTKNWMKEDSWASRWSAFFVVFVFMFNLFAWGVYGLTSIFEFIGFIFKKIWWLLLWIWNEVLHPTVFALAMLLWHYVVVLFFKFFQFSIYLIPESLQRENIFYSFIKLLLLGGVFALALAVYLLTSSLIALIIGLLVFFFFMQYSVFSTVARLREDTYFSFQIFPNIQIVALWMLLSGIATALLVLLKVYSTNYIISGLGVTLTQILIPIFVLTFIAFISATFYLPAFVSTQKDEFKIFDFLKAILYRLPKLIAAKPFYLLGMVLAGFIPLLIAMLLNFGMEGITGKNTIQWSTDILSMGNHIPTYKSNKKAIEYQKELLIYASSKKDSLAKYYDNQINNVNRNLQTAFEDKAKIPYNSIHTFSGNVYVGEDQFFSIPQLPGCSNYEWFIKNAKNEIVYKKVITDEEQAVQKSFLINYQWNKAGEYTVLLTPRNQCGTSRPIELPVNVLERPKLIPTIEKPSGKTDVCVNENIVFTAPRGFSSYSWITPQGVQKISQNNSSITVKWGDTSGTIRVSGIDKEGNHTNWTGRYVTVKAIPGKTTKNSGEIPDDTVIQFQPEHPNYFKTRELADNSIGSMKSMMESLQQEKTNGLESINGQIDNLNSSITSFTNDSKDQINKLISEILALIGLVLLMAIAFCSIWTYSIAFQFDLYGFEQDGKHYWSALRNKIKEKNSNQPLLGIFVLLIFLFVFTLLSSYYLMHNDWQNLILRIVQKQ